MEATKISAQNGGSPKIQKPHRKIVSGLKLLNPSSEFSSDTLRKRRGTEVCESQLELPHDLITHEILTRVPIKSLLQLKSVSKEWYYTLSSYAFSNAHLKASVSSSPVECLFIHAENNYYLFFYNEQEEGAHFLEYSLVKLELEFDDQNELQLVGSSNGIVCLKYSSPLSSHIYITNPITRDCCKFADPFLSSFTNYQTSWGFGYVSSVDDYKVVRLIQDYTTHKLIVHIFSLRSQEWKGVQDHGLDHTVSLTKPNPGVLVKETLFWLMDTKGPVVVVGFSLAREKFEKITDLEARSVTPWNQCLCEMGGCLGMQEEGGVLSVLKKPGKVESMSFPSDLGMRLSCGLVGSTKGGRLFGISKKWELALIDPSKSPTECTPLLTFKGGGDATTSIIRYLPTLTSPSFLW